LTTINAQDILEFWFTESHKKLWFNSTLEFDRLIINKFESIWKTAASRQLDHWRNNPESSLALIIILDQFPLNMYRGDAESFSTESYAVEVAHHSLDNHFDRTLNRDQLTFLYLPLMNSENLEDQNLSVKLYKAAELDSNLRFAMHHRDIIKKYGRFPHRNSILGRNSTNEETIYLQSQQAFKG